MHIFHRWGKWQIGEAVYGNRFNDRKYTAVIQARDCGICGKRQIKRV